MLCVIFSQAPTIAWLVGPRGTRTGWVSSLSAGDHGGLGHALEIAVARHKRATAEKATRTMCMATIFLEAALVEDRIARRMAGVVDGRIRRPYREGMLDLHALWSHPFAAVALVWAYVWGVRFSIQEVRRRRAGEDAFWMPIVGVSMSLGYLLALVLTFALLSASATTDHSFIGLAAVALYLATGFVLALPIGVAVVVGSAVVMLVGAVWDFVNRRQVRSI